MELFIIVTCFAWAVACAVIAGNKNRNQAGWFVLGALAGIFSLGVLLLLKPLPVVEG